VKNTIVCPTIGPPLSVRVKLTENRWADLLAGVARSVEGLC
jgi:hypothetical protein